MAELLRYLWRAEIYDAEVLRSEFDAGGYDLVVSRGEVVRHVQLKAKRLRGKTSRFIVSDRLATREAGCVLVFVVDDDLTLDHYRWFGGKPHEPLPLTREYRRAYHTRGDATGSKGKRREHFQLPLSDFTELSEIDQVAQALLGTLQARSTSAAPHPAGNR